ncbi:MAG: hypothetical protein OER90_05900 [Gemmatimonadota bacterium]|nr:hypothetical protein [Gemmatimonadota bacterium]
MMIVIGACLLACASGEEMPRAGQGDTSETAMVAAPAAVPVETVSVPLELEVAAAPRQRPGDSVVVGVVRMVGAMPLEQLVLQAGGSSVSLRGMLRDELKNLEGAELRAWGKPVDNAPPTPPRALDVAGYEIVSVGGAKPVVGILSLREGALHVVGTDTLRLEAAPERLRTKPGAKVWLVGTRDGSTLRVQSYGIVREPQ